MKLSIVIPIYGVEKFIEKCLMSCINQGDAKLGPDYEIICVNDGTKDKSAEIARHIASQFEGISVIDQENQGLSVARNTGTSAANGEYIWYVDSDDYIEEKCLERIIPLLKDDLDILQLKWRCVYEDNTPPQDAISLYVNKRISGKELLKYGRLVSPAQFVILRKSFLEDNKLSFFPGIYHEDSEFKPRASYLADSIEFDTLVSYNYLQRSAGSIMSTYRPRRMYDSMIIVDNLLDFMNDKVHAFDKSKWAKSLSGPLAEVLYLANFSKDKKMENDAKTFVRRRNTLCTYVFTCSPSYFLRLIGYASKVFNMSIFEIYKLFYRFRY